MALRIPLEQIRQYWAARQKLDAPPGVQVVGLLQESGWINSPSSTGPYLAIRARGIEYSRREVDRAVFEGNDLLEVPGMRGCTMLVPCEDVPLALACARRYHNERFAKIQSACAIGEQEAARLAEGIKKELADGPVSFQRLRERLPETLVRGLGREGDRFGEKSTLTFMLRRLQVEGLICRFASEGRLDSRHRNYRLLPAKCAEALPRADVVRQLAVRFFRWAAPATPQEFCWWMGVSLREAKEAIESLGMLAAEIPDWSDEAWIPADQVEEVAGFSPREEAQDFKFLPFRDNYLYFRRGLAPFLKAEDRGKEVLDCMERRVPVAELESLHHNAVVAAGRLEGIWEYDPERKKVAWRLFGKLEGERRRVFAGMVEELEEFIRRELGDVQFYPFDAGSKRRERIDSLR